MARAVGAAGALAAGNIPPAGWEEFDDAARVTPGFRRVRPARLEGRRRTSLGRRPRSGIYCVAYAVDDGPVQLWAPPDPVPPEWFEAANNTDWRVAAHNDPYESAVERDILHPRYGFPLIPLERHICTHDGGAGTRLAGEAWPARGCARARQPERCRRREADAADGEAAKAPER